MKLSFGAPSHLIFIGGLRQMPFSIDYKHGSAYIPEELQEGLLRI